MTMLALASPWMAVLSFDLRCATQVLPIARGRPGAPPPRSLPKQVVNGNRQHTARAEIPIAADARPHQTSRGFLPWRFAYAGPTVSVAPPSSGRHPQTFTNSEVGGRNREVRFTPDNGPPLTATACPSLPTVDIAGVSFWISASIANRLKRRPELTVNT